MPDTTAGMAGRAARAARQDRPDDPARRVAELEAENAALRRALAEAGRGAGPGAAAAAAAAAGEGGHGGRLLAAAPHPYLVLRPDAPRFTIAAASGAHLRATMADGAGIVGRGVFEAFPADPADPAATGARNLRASLERVLASRAPDRMPVRRHDARRPDGTFEERHWSPLNLPVPGPGGGVEAIIHHVEDVTALVRAGAGIAGADRDAAREVARANAELGAANAALREREERLRLVLDSAADYAIIGMGLDRRVTSWNAGAERLLGWPEAEIVGRSAHAIFTPEDRDAGLPQQEAAGALRDGRAANERWHVRKDGSRFWGSGLVMPLRDLGAGPAAPPLGLLKVMRDRTEERRAEARLAALVEVGDRLRDLRGTAAIADISEVVGRALGAARAGYGTVDAAEEGFRVERDWSDGRLGNSAGTYRLSDFWTGFADHLRRGEVVAIGDAARDPRTAGRPADAYAAAGVRAFVNVPLVQGGRVAAILYVQDVAPRAWSKEEVAFARGVAERILAAAERAQAEARRAALVELGDRLRDLRDPGEIARAAAEVIGRAVGAARAGYAVVDAAQETARVERDWTGGPLGSVAGEHRLPDRWGGFADHLRRGEAVAVGDAARDPRTARHADGYAALGIRAFVHVPLVERGRVAAVLFVHDRVARDWTEEEVAFVRGAADRAWAAAERARAEEGLRESERRLRATQEHAGVGITEIDADGRFVRVNETFTRLSGWTAADFAGKAYWDEIEAPEDRRDARRDFARLVRGEVDRLHAQREYADRRGRRWWADITATAIRGAPDAEHPEGRFLCAVRVVQDITERKRAEARRALLVNELNHRVKNTLAVVQSLALQTARGAPDLPSFSAVFQARLIALARAHDLLTRGSWEGAPLAEVARAALAPSTAGGVATRVDLGACASDALLPPAQALALAMALHELAANALKHGALSAPGGRVRVACRADADDGARVVEWVERGGPPVLGPPARKGFGLRLLQRGLAAQAGLAADLRFEPEGVRCTLRLPPARQAATGER